MAAALAAAAAAAVAAAAAAAAAALGGTATYSALRLTWTCNRLHHVVLLPNYKQITCLAPLV